MKEDFAILGDLGEGRYIVRMWAHGHTIDEEIEAPSITKLLDIIDDKLDGFTANKAAKAGVKEDKPDPKDWMGHAVAVTEEQGLGYKGRIT